VALTDPSGWDRHALRDGISVAALGAVPFGVIGRLIVGDDGSRSVLALFTFLVLIALLMGGAIAAWRQELGRPLSHGIATALITFAAVQLVGIVRRAVAGDDIRWGRILSTALLTLIVGTVGGLVGGFMQSRGVRSKLP
jgi:hypothetical protein